MNSLFRLIGFTIFCILLIGGLLTSVFAHSIEAALTVPANRTPSPVTVPKTTTPTPAAVITAGTIPTPVPANILAQDTFQRADQLLWGTASDGQAWGGDATNKAVFAIATMTGQAANGQGGFNATLGPMITDAEVQFSGSMNQFKQSNFGALLRWTDANDWYKAYIDGTNLILLKNMAGMATRLGAVPFKAAAKVAYTLRFRVSGTSLSAKAWQTGNPEPANWMVTATDTSFQGGFGGLRFLLKNGIVARITMFKETTLTPNQ